MKKILVVFLVVLMFLSGCSIFKEREVSLSKVSVNGDGSIRIEGRGRAFENTIGIKVVDGNDFILFQGSTITDAKDMGQFGNFKEDIKLKVFPQTDKIKVVAYIASPKDGTITSSDEKSINYGMPYKTVLVFYGNTKKNPEMLDCTKVFPVERRIASSSQDIPIDTMKIFLLGPTKNEESEGYLMTTPKNLTINKIEKITSNKVQIDFGKELLVIAGGSCRVAAIRAEITKTLEQFYPGYEVIISANGNTEEVLQP
ncbi:Gmad2 immunoglobulin-like domain-containing protein [Caldisericum exile]|uniref:GerMN domain-containing protein n=1 Tax=Caldisericum exile (strain DSM 21853 / NBRC 104410 / AZM16c01) TaxID=511051 RepID=A0A7U6GES2_CALEA|nr:Gmad2 immunoglobulin-like domain-containing protein [Caldisericum exile]BAL81044.1 hypothetical protein CSE_09180 [Caldisericum exile AZM16c01]